MYLNQDALSQNGYGWDLTPNSPTPERSSVLERPDERLNHKLTRLFNQLFSVYIDIRAHDHVDRPVTLGPVTFQSPVTLNSIIFVRGGG